MASQAAAATVHNRPSDLALRWTTLLYLGVMVALPMVALGVQAARPGLAHSGGPSQTPMPGTP